MAGIGFELRKLTQRNDFLGILQGYAHSAIASSGPWLFTILSLGCIITLGPLFTSPEKLATFRIIIIYNFAFSLVLSGPVIMMATRYLADMIHEKDVREAPAMMLGCLLLSFALQAWIAGPFYLFVAKLDPGTRIAALFNFFLISGIWVAGIFLTALKEYKVVSAAFGVGMVLGCGATFFLAESYSVTGMLTGFNTGLAVIFFTLVARVLAEYPYAAHRPFHGLRGFWKYWEVGLGGLLYNLAIWVDKWIMWLSPEKETLSSGMVSYPDYDSAMFLAYLTIVPSMAVFVFGVETDFFEKYLRFYRDIQRHANFTKISRNHEDIVRSLLESGRNFIILQGGICFVTILLAPRIFEILDLNFVQLSMFRFGVLGAFFHVLILVMSIILYYFDLRRTTVLIQLFFLLTNAGFTFFSLKLGFAFYGYGYFLSALTTFSLTFLATAFHLNRLPYQAFVCNNASVR